MRMKISHISGIVLLLLFFLSGNVSAQQTSQVKGTVLDESMAPLEGVTVTVLNKSGTSKKFSTVTDSNGLFTFSQLMINQSYIFKFSRVGYEQHALQNFVLKDGDDNTIVIKMVADDSNNLDEVVVVGYGTAKKRDLTGAVVKVDLEKQGDLANTNVLQSLKGSVPGLNIGATNSAGETPSLSIRGQNTLSTSSGENMPLIVVDGIIYRGSITDINPSNIESVEILKDASAASIYGSQASNGVFLITTKKGVDTGKPVIAYTGQYSIETPAKELKPLQGEAYKSFLKDVFWDQFYLAPKYVSENPKFSLENTLKTAAMREGYLNGVDNNWYDAFTGNGALNNHNLSISGRNQNAGYFVSGGLTDQKGFVKNDRYKRYDIRANLDFSITDWLNVGMESFMASTNRPKFSPDYGNVYQMQPFAPIYDSNHEFVLQPDALRLNPYLESQIDYDYRQVNLFGNFHADIKIKQLKGFNYRVNYSHNYRTVHTNKFNPWGANFTGEGNKKNDIGYDWSLDNIFSYKNQFGNNHRIDFTGVYGVEKRMLDVTDAGAADFENDILGYHYLEAGNANLRTVKSSREEETSLYMMGRLFYSFKDKYMITGTVRRDGFSGFGPKKKIGVFPSLALGWVASDEDFFPAKDVINYLKIRGSYGTTARRAVSRYETLARITSDFYHVWGDGGTPVLGQFIKSLANNELGWELTRGINLGLDFTLLNSRVSGNFEFYKNNTKDILYSIQLPYLTGFGNIMSNIGKVKNHGFEFTVNGKIIDGPALKWDASLNFSSYRNSIVSILGRDGNGDGKEDDLTANGLFIGQPQNVIYDYEVVGMWQLEDQAAGRIPTGFFPGTYKLNDLNGDNLISAADDRKILGYGDPSYRMGLGSTLTYKGFSLYLFINTVQGGGKYYFGRSAPENEPGFSKRDQLSYSNAMGWDYWTPNNPDARYRRLDVGSSFGGQPIMQRNFIRLQDLSLSYRLNDQIAKKLGLAKARIFVSGKNLLTITNWDGLDPELNIGIAVKSPLMRSYTVGLNFEL